MRAKKNSYVLKRLLFTIIMIGIFSHYVSGQATVYVNPSASGLNNGTSWSNAFIDLQSALNTAISGDEIWVKQGIYKPTTTINGTNGGQNNVFHFDNKDLKIYGGFAGNETLRSQRSTNANLTRLSGDINGNDNISGAGSTLTLTNLSDNHYRIFEFSNTTTSTEIDGFTFSGGNANVSLREAGGLYISNSSPMINNCIFRGNFSGLKGSAIAFSGTGVSTVSNCIFSKNYGDERGGAVYIANSGGSFINCQFEDNRTSTNGSAIYADNNTLTLTNTVIDNNYTASGTGAVSAVGTAIIADQCTFTQNSALSVGALSCGNLTLSNSTFSQNSSGQGSALTAYGNVSILNCNFSQNQTTNSSAVDILNANNYLIEDCTFSQNQSTYFGGALKVFTTSAAMNGVVRNCIFDQNNSPKGGAILIFNQSTNTLNPIFTNCLFVKNTATTFGGAVYSDNMTTGIIEPDFINCTFEQNTAPIGGGIYNLDNITASITNSILWNNGDEIYNDASSNTTIQHSNIEGSGGSTAWNNTLGIDAGNNIDNNPLFINTTNDWSLQTTSPAINIGNNSANTTTLDLLGNARIQGNTIDLGAFESNVQPAVINIFNITGGGIYCTGTPLVVGLDGSDIGVNYQLELNGVNIGNPVIGTGNAISFGNQSGIGIYTVTASSVSTTAMQGNVAITAGVSAMVNQVADINACNGDVIPTTTFTMPSFATYSWTNSNTSIGLGASGNGNLPAFTATNTTNAVTSATITVTPQIVPSRFYITGRNSSSVYGFNTLNNQFTFGVSMNFADSYGTSVSPDNKYVYVTHPYANSVSVMETNASTIFANVTVGSDPHGIAVSPNNLKVYVANQGDNTVSVIDATTNTVINTIAVGNRPHGVAFAPNGDFAYITNLNSADVTVINALTEAVVATIPVGSFPRGIVVSPDNNYVYVANLGSDNVSVIDAVTKQVITTVNVGDGPFGIAINATGRQVYVTNTNSSSANPPVVSFIDCDVSNNTFVNNTNVQVGALPQGISVDPTTGFLYVAHYYPRRISIIDPSSASIVSMFTSPIPFEPICFGNFIGASPSTCPPTPMTFEIKVAPKPVTFNPTGGGPYCLGSPVVLGLDGSEVGVNYQVQLNGINIGNQVVGTGNAISFGNFTAVGTYQIIAENAGGCQTVVDVIIEDCYCPVTWVKLINTQVNVNTLEKVSGNNSFNGAAISDALLLAGTDGWASMEVIETNTARVFGLAQSNTNTNVGAINYGIRLRGNSRFRIIENGTPRGVLGIYATGDIFKIERIGTTIYYFQNGNLFYTSAVPSTTNLIVDVALRQIGSTIHNAQVSFGCIDPCFNFAINLVNQANETCQGANDGEIVVSANSTGIVWSWADNPNLNTNVRTNLAPGNYTVTATDINGCTTIMTITITSGAVACVVYVHSETSLDCDADFFCHPINAQYAVPNGIEGINFCIDYDPDIMEPTGRVVLGNVVLNGGTGQYSLAVISPGNVQVGVYYTSGPGSYLTGIGNILCIEFRVIQSDLLLSGTYPINDCGVIETYNPTINPAIDVFTNADNGRLILNGSSADIMNGRLTYRDDVNNPIINTGTANIFAKIYANTSACNNPVSGSIQPISPNSPSTQWGYFQLPMNGEKNVEVVRSLNAGIMVMDVINGADAALTWQISTGLHDADIFELISADVNGSGMVTPGDMTWIYQRSTLLQTNFPNNVKDWEFISEGMLQNPNFITASQGGNANRYDVPNVGDCMEFSPSTNCSGWNDANIYSILIGDVDGNWEHLQHAPTKSNQQIRLDVNQAVNLGNNIFEIPVYYQSADAIFAIDFNIDYDETKLSILEINPTITTQNQTQMLWNDYQNDRILLSSAIVNGMETTDAVYTIKVQTTNGQLDASYFIEHESQAYLNGSNVNLEVTGAVTNTQNQFVIDNIEVYPNPFKNQLIIDFKNVTEKVETIDLYTINGVLVRSIEISNTNQTTIHTEDLASGVYIISVNNTKHIKVVKTK